MFLRQKNKKWRGTVQTELRLRVVATPEPATAQPLAHLGLRLPQGPRIIANVVPKNSPKNAQVVAPQQKCSAN